MSIERLTPVASADQLRWKAVHGWVHATGVFVPMADEQHSLNQKQANELWRHYCAGSEILLFAGLGCWLRWSEPQLLNTHAQDAIAMVATAQPGNVILDSDSAVNAHLQQQLQHGPKGQGLLLLGGQFYGLDVSQAQRLNPADWLDLSTVTWSHPQAFPALPVAELMPEAAVDEAVPLRSALDSVVAEPDEDSKQVAKALFENAQKSAEVGGRHSGSGAGGAARGLAVFAVAVARMVKSFSDGFHGQGRSGHANAGQTYEHEGTSQKPSHSALRRWAERVLFNSGLGRWAGVKQAKYISQMLDMFKDGDLDEALKRAIPLGQDGLADPDDLPAWGQPGMRPDFAITGGEGRGRSMVGGEDLYDHLRKTYRQAFQRLDAAGRYQEAAFVLAELLQENAEAVAYLEGKGLLQQAAEVAEVRKLPAEVVVRQWLLAGDTERALLIAQRHGCYAQVVRLLEQKNAELASKVRLLWADAEWDAGNHIQALRAIWPVQEAVKIRNGMLSQVLEQDIANSASVLPVVAMALNAHKPPTEALPDELVMLLQQHLDTLANAHDGEHGEQRLWASWRAELLTELDGQGNGVSSLVVQQPTLVKLLRQSVIDHAHGHYYWHRQALVETLKKAGLNSLAWDIPGDWRGADKKRTGLANAGSEAAKRGRLHVLSQQQIADVRLLDNGQLLLACGEAGVLLLSCTGHVRRRFNAPCDQLVLAANQNRAVAIAYRGQRQLLHQLDLNNGQVAFWTEASLQRCCDHYEGHLWWVAQPHALQALTMGALDDQRFASNWQVPDLPGEILLIEQDQQSVALLLACQDGLQYWRYDRQALMLRERITLASAVHGATTASLQRPGFYQSVVVDEDGAVLLASERFHGDMNTVELRCDGALVRLGSIEGDVPSTITQLACQLDWQALVMQQGELATVLICTHAGQVRMQLELPAAKCAAIRWVGESLVVWSEVGHLAVLDTKTADWRLASGFVVQRFEWLDVGRTDGD